MRLRSWVVLMSALLTAIPVMADNNAYGYPYRTGGNYAGPRWYGYYGNNNSFDSYVPQNADHTNITEIWATYSIDPDRSHQLSDARTAILDNLAVAKQYGERAMVDVGAIVLLPGYNSDSPCYGENPVAATDFQDLVQTLIDAGYLIPNHPESGTVSSFYVADEPDGNCLYDSLDASFNPVAPNPSLLNAISVIRQNADTTNFPLATIVTNHKYGNMPYGLGLFDWIGMDDYDTDVATYVNDFSLFERDAANNDAVGGTPQQFMLIPVVSSQVGSAGPFSKGAPYMQARFLADNSVIGIMPFKWQPPTKPDGTPNPDGMNDTSSWAPGYIALGKSIVFVANLPAETTVITDFLIPH